MSGKGFDRDSREQLRRLAGQTLQAYRSLNAAAARRSDSENNGDQDPVARASEMLQEVLSSLRGGGNGRHG